MTVKTKLTHTDMHGVREQAYCDRYYPISHPFLLFTLQPRSSQGLLCCCCYYCYVVAVVSTSNALLLLPHHTPHIFFAGAVAPLPPYHP
jgi:hypothetical protein